MTAATLSNATFSDANPAAPASDFTVTAVTWGDGGTDTTGLTVSGSGGNYTVAGSHMYAEEGAYPFSITVTDVGGQTTTITGSITVADAALVNTGAPANAIAGLPLTGITVATFTDPGGAEPNPGDPSGTINDHYQVVSINWGDGTPLDTTSGALSYGGSPGSTTASLTVSGSHTYTTALSGTITVILQHEALTTTVTSSVTVKDNLGLLVLDPSGRGALTVDGNGVVAVNNAGALVVNSSNAAAATITGNGSVSAADIDVTGGARRTGNATFSGAIGQERPRPIPCASPCPRPQRQPLPP